MPNKYIKNQPRQLPAATEDCYVFDKFLGCRYIAFSSASKERNMGKSIYEIMSADGAQELLEHMKNNPTVPMFVSTVHGTALVISLLAPSYSLGILIYAHIGSDTLYRICRKSEIAASYAKELVVGKRCRMTKHCMQNKEYALTLMSSYLRIFSKDMCNRVLTGNLSELIKTQISQITRFVNCPTDIECKGDMIAYSDFDMGMLTAYLLLIALTARMFSSDGKLSLCLETRNRIPLIKFSIKLRGSDSLRLPSLETLRFTAYQNGMPFDYCRTDGIFSGELSPLTNYLSRLANKSPQQPPLTSELEIFIRTQAPSINADTLLTVEQMFALRDILLSNSDIPDFWKDSYTT